MESHRLGLGYPDPNKRIAVSWCTVSVDKDDGSRSVSDTRFFVDAKHHLTDADDESGAYPLWKPYSRTIWFAFVPSKGTSKPVSDLLMLSAWEYSKTSEEYRQLQQQ
jgi:hypothetical protein